MGREIDAQCAQLLGWVPVATPTYQNGKWVEYDDWRSPDYEYRSTPPHFSTDPSCVPSLLAAVEKHNKTHLYIMALMEQVKAHTFYAVDSGVQTGMVWAMLRATPEQHARAFVEVMSDVHDEA